MFFLEKDMKKSLVFLFGFLLLTSFVFAIIGEPQQTNLGEDVGFGSKEVVGEIITNLKSNLTKENLIDNSSIIGTELPDFLKLIYDVTTIEGLIIYISFFVMILILIYGVVEIFSNNKTVRGIIALSVTLLATITGSIQKVMTFYLGIDLINLNYKIISWKIIFIILGVIVILALTKLIVHKMKINADKDQAWWKGFKLWAMSKKSEIK